MNRITLVILVLLLNSCQKNRQNTEQIIFARLAFVYNLKPLVANKIWKNFDNKLYDVPLIYYTDSTSYVTNPTIDFLRIFHPKLVFKNSKIAIYKTLKRVDTIPFHMETSLSSGSPSDDYDYHSPFMKCSSYEITSRIVPNTKSTEYWVTMLVHEYFHGFQYKHKSYIDSTIAFLSSLSEDSLSKIYQKNEWFQKKIKAENYFLLQAIHSTNQSEINKNITRFFEIRKDRRSLFKRRFNYAIDEYEKKFETMEGTARYVEFKLHSEFATLKPDKKLKNIDSSFHSFYVFKNYKIQNDPWLYKVGKRYFYSTGFNMVRLLDKLKINYRDRLFKEGNLTLEELLLDDTSPKKVQSNL